MVESMVQRFMMAEVWLFRKFVETKKLVIATVSSPHVMQCNAICKYVLCCAIEQFLLC